METDFGWVLSGGDTQSTEQVNLLATAFHTTVSSDDILRRFWEIEEPAVKPVYSQDEQAVIQHFEINHSRLDDGRFVVPLPRKTDAGPIGESRTQAVRRFYSLERSLAYKKQTPEFNKIMLEYLDLGHAELVPHEDLNKPVSEVFYMPMHVVYKSSSTTTKIRAVFDGSAKSSTGVSLNDTFLVGPTVHSTLLDVLLRFRKHRVALTADVSKMYRAVALEKSNRDLHRFVWRNSREDKLKDYRMTRVTFGISASSFAANMAIQQNAIDLCSEFPHAAKVVQESFYVDDCLTGADSVQEAITLQVELQSLLSRGGFLLRKWSSNDTSVLDHLSQDLLEQQETHPISDSSNYTKTLGLEWNTSLDQFNLTISQYTSPESITKRMLVSEVAKVFDIMGWFSPTIITMKILLQQLWELRLDWDDLVPSNIKQAWERWRSELPDLATHAIPHCHFPRDKTIVSTQLHGFCDASENAYAGVVYLRLVDSCDHVHISLIMSKTKVAPMKRLSIPRLELCGAVVLSHLVQHVKSVYNIPLSDIYAWTDSTVVLSWLSGNPKRFKVYVGNRVSSIIDRIPPDRWKHVPGIENPTDCASRGLFPTELLTHQLWWHGPDWLSLSSANWPEQPSIVAEPISAEEREICLVAPIAIPQSMLVNRFSSFTKLKRITAWILRFCNNCCTTKSSRNLSPHLTVSELIAAENHWFKYAQSNDFSAEIVSLQAKKPISKSSRLLHFHPFLDSHSILRVKGRQAHSSISYARMHPIILHGRNPITKLIISTEHIRMMHAGPTMLLSSLTRRFHILYMRKTVRSITRGCIICRRLTVKPQPQLLGQLPVERITATPVFNKVGVDYAGPFLVKYGAVRKRATVKSYVCIFVCLAIKAVHLELVSDLTAEAFLAALRRFTARRGYPTLIWSDNGRNFVGAKRELSEMYEFLEQQINDGTLSQFCTDKHIEWKFIPEHGPHFGRPP